METPSTRTWWGSGLCGDMTERDQANVARFGQWSILWALGFVAATLALSTSVVPAGALSYAVALAPSLLGLGAMIAYMRFLREADELQRTIHLQALALGFGAGVLFMMGYRLFERLGAPGLDINDPMLVMVLFWALGQYLGARRYA